MTHNELHKSIVELMQIPGLIPHETTDNEFLSLPRQDDEAIDYLRFIVKYLIFDVEALRRENKYLRQWISHL